jgi:hypothetical protein
LEPSKTDLAGETEVDSCDLGLERLKQMFSNSWMNEWMKEFSSAMLDSSRNLNCHGRVQCSTASIWLEFCRILLQSTPIIPVDDEQIEKQAKEMKKIDEKSERILRAKV